MVWARLAHTPSTEGNQMGLTRLGGGVGMDEGWERRPAAAAAAGRDLSHLIQESRQVMFSSVATFLAGGFSGLNFLGLLFCFSVLLFVLAII